MHAVLAQRLDTIDRVLARSPTLADIRGLLQVMGMPPRAELMPAIERVRSRRAELAKRLDMLQTAVVTRELGSGRLHGLAARYRHGLRDVELPAECATPAIQRARDRVRAGSTRAVWDYVELGLTQKQAAERLSVGDRLRSMRATLGGLVSSGAAWDMLELAMATAVSVSCSIRDDSPLVRLLLAGAPSSGKTTSVLPLRGLPMTEFLDQLTPEAFVSGAVNAKTGRGARALLPMLDKKCLVVKDLTTLFSQRDDKVKKILGDLQSIYDGEFNKATGTAFDSEPVLRHVSKFSLLGCITTAALAAHQDHMAQIGSRFLIYRVPALTPEERERGFQLSDRRRNPFKSELRAYLSALVHVTVENAIAQGDSLVAIDSASEARLRELAGFVAAGRTPTYWEGSEPALGEPEEPFRVYQQLGTLLRALVLINRRTAPTWHEMGLVTRVALGSIPGRRAEVLDALRASRSGELTVKAYTDQIEKSENQARRRLDLLVRIGLFERVNGVGAGAGRPEGRYRLAERFRHLLP